MIEISNKGKIEEIEIAKLRRSGNSIDNETVEEDI